MLYEAKMARVVLEDCRWALAELRADPPGRAWRIRWFGALAMLRAVGHVLERIDKKSSPEMKEAISDWWNNLKSTKPYPAVFWEFIDRERDAILKEYKYRAAQNTTVHLGTGSITYTYDIHDGPFDGQDPRDVVQQAIEWWEQQLAGIEAGAKRRNS